jgi:2,5-diamino-6-(ribosylamino)-4(3H)-pyrimidinone 5'-phosphate reductase
MYFGVVPGRSDDLPLRGSALRLVTFNVASIDGRIAVSRSTPSWLDPKWKPLDRFETVDALSLHGARVCLQGSNSFTGRDAPGASFTGHAEAQVPAGDFLPASLRTHPGRWYVAIDSRARVRWTTNEMDGTKLAVLMSRTTPAAYRLFLREHDVPYLEVGEDRVDLGRALHRLGAVFGVDCVVSDAGGVLNGVLLRAGLVDEIDVQFLPVVIGRAEAPAIFEGYDLGTWGSIRDLDLISAETRPDASVFVRYAVR